MYNWMLLIMIVMVAVNMFITGSILMMTILTLKSSNLDRDFERLERTSSISSVIAGLQVYQVTLELTCASLAAYKTNVPLQTYFCNSKSRDY
uniref:Uncharacterized protein n=1 Tax=Cucumis melo TaxID=3656 RepID=A0A9I9EJX3_CUCME